MSSKAKRRELVHHGSTGSLTSSDRAARKQESREKWLERRREKRAQKKAEREVKK